MTDRIEKLTGIFSRFPGIGQKQAKRFVYFLLSQNSSFIKEFLEEVSSIKKNIKTCQSCFKFFLENKISSDSKICQICKSPERERHLMVVCRDIDLENMERSGSFKGKYFVLGGSLPILEKQPEKKIRVDSLIERVKKLLEDGLEEIILAMDFNPEGENTGEFVKKSLTPLSEKYKFKISTLGKGLSLGTEIEYSDPETIKNALINRH